MYACICYTLLEKVKNIVLPMAKYGHSGPKKSHEIAIKFEKWCPSRLNNEHITTQPDGPDVCKSFCRLQHFSDPPSHSFGGFPVYLLVEGKF